jgi:hypothetical protein
VQFLLLFLPAPLFGQGCRAILASIQQFQHLLQELQGTLAPEFHFLE